MDMPPAWSQTCMCWTDIFCTTYLHIPCAHLSADKSCFFFYEKATFLRDVLQAKKRRKMEDMIRGEASDSNHRLRRSYRPTRRCQIPETTYGESQDLNRPIAERRVQRQNRQLPKLYRDTCPALCKLFRFLFLFILCRTHL
jgi:hypothetical protein